MLLVSIGRVAQFAILLLTLHLATSFLAPSEMGKISIVTATVAFFALFLLNPVGLFMNRRLHAWDSKGQVRSYLAYFWLYLFIVSICAALILIMLSWFNILKLGISIYWLLFLVCGNLVFATVNQVVIPGLNLFGHRGWFTFLTVATAVMSLIFAVALVYALVPSAENWLTGLLLGQLVIGLIGKKVFFEKLKSTHSVSRVTPKLSHSHLINLLKFAWPVAIAVGLGWVQSQGYRYLMGSSLGLIELGLFVAGFGISSGLIAGFDSVFSTYFQPKFYKKISKDNISEQSSAWIEYAHAVLPALLLTSIFIMVMAQELTNLLLGAVYSQSAQFVVWGALAELARTSTAVFGMVAHARMNTRMLLLPNLVGALLSILLIWNFAPIYGSSGVGAGLACSSLVSLLLTIRITKNNFSVVLPVNIFFKSIVIGAGIFLIAEILSVTLNYDGSNLFSFVRLCVIGLIFISAQYFMLIPVLKRDRLSF